MCYTVEIDLFAGERYRLYLEEDYAEYDQWPERQALSNEQKRQRRERDKEQFLREFYADYDWGLYRWNEPEQEVRDLLRLIGQIDMLFGNRLPANNAELEEVMKDAVLEGWIIPEVDERQWAGSYAPAANAGPVTLNNDGILASAESFEPYRSAALRSGEPILSGPYDPSTQEAKLKAARGVSFDSAQPFEFEPDTLGGDVEELAATTNNPRYAARMLGYDQNTFSDMLHIFKPANGLGPADNVLFHDDGSVEFNGQMLDDNIHNYAP